jgi:hypothetical protein
MSTLMSVLLLQAATVTPPATTQVAATPADDAKIVCRTITPTGSRLGGKRICLSKKEWRRMHEAGQEAAGDIQDEFSKRPGAQ